MVFLMLKFAVLERKQKIVKPIICFLLRCQSQIRYDYFSLVGEISLSTAETNNKCREKKDR